MAIKNDKLSYQKFLADYDFNEEQIAFITQVRESFLNLRDDQPAEYCECCKQKLPVPEFDYDGYERDLWYTMNRSGLFEDCEENKSGITDWTQSDTQKFITEY